MNTVPDDIYGFPETHADARVLELTAQIRQLQTELQRQKASASENAKLFAQMDARLKELSALNKVSRSIISTLDIHELLQAGLQQTVQVTNADTGSIMLLDPGLQQLRIAVAHGLAGDVVHGASVPLGEGVAGWVAKYKRPLLVPNVSNDPRFQLRSPRHEIKSAMSVPMLSRGETLGVLNVARSSSSKPFTGQDLQLLTTITSQLSLAVENARLFETAQQRYEHLSTLMELSRQLNSTLSAREVMDIIVEQTQLILRADACVIYLRDERHEVLRARSYQGLSVKFARKVRGKLGHGLIGDVAVSGQPIFVADIRRSPRMEYAEDHAAAGIRSMLCAPLRFSGQSLGALAVYSRTERQYGENELNMLMAIAGQGAMAIHNAENYQKQRGIAELVQNNLKPHVCTVHTDVQIGHRYIPAQTVGGDYYDIFDLPDNRLGILIADVAGKSVEAAVHTAKGKYYIRALGHYAESPADVLARANSLINADTDIDSFISVFYAVLENGARLRYCNAGHPPPLLVRPDSTITELANSSLLLGILPDTHFQEHHLDLQSGDTLVLTTDGVTEARGNTSLYGQERLIRCVLAHPSLDPQALADCICEEVSQFSGTHARDDVAVLVLRVP